LLCRGRISSSIEPFNVNRPKPHVGAVMLKGEMPMSREREPRVRREFALFHSLHEVRAAYFIGGHARSVQPMFDSILTYRNARNVEAVRECGNQG
jgi:hypothetical protein